MPRWFAAPFRSVRSVAQHAASVPGPATTAPTRRRASRAPAKTTLRPWQQRAVSAMADWVDGPFLVAAAPGAGKTRPGAARRAPAAADALDRPGGGRLPDRAADPPVGRGGGVAWGCSSRPTRANLRPPSGFDGVAVTYARVAQSGARWAKQCSPGTFVIADEAHHLGDELAWGQGFNAAFGDRRALAAAVGHAVSLGRGADPGRPLRQRRHRRAGRHVLVCRRGPRRRLPAGHVRALRRGAAVAVGGGDDRGVVRRRGPLARGGAALPHRDQRRARRRAAADPRRRAREAAGDPRGRPSRRRRAGRRRRRRARARGGEGAARGDRQAAAGRAAHGGAGGREARGVPLGARAVDRRGQHGLRGRRHPAPARRRLRDRGQDAADLPPDRRALRAHDPGARAGHELAVPARRPRPARARRRCRERPQPDPAAAGPR